MNPHLRATQKKGQFAFDFSAPVAGKGLTITTVAGTSSPALFNLMIQILTGRATNSLPAELISEVQDAGILVRADSVRDVPVFSFPSMETPDLPDADFQRSELISKGCAILRGLTTRPILDALQNYYNELFSGGFMVFDSTLKRHTLHNEAASQWLHTCLLPTVAQVTPEVVKPSYTYLGFYGAGGVLHPHTDRAQCEYTVSFTLQATPSSAAEDAWPLHIDLRDGSTATAMLGAGDGMIFKGRELSHYRRPLEPGRTSWSIFLHYVSENFEGPLD